MRTSCALAVLLTLVACSDDGKPKSPVSVPTSRHAAQLESIGRSAGCDDVHELSTEHEPGFAAAAECEANGHYVRIDVNPGMTKATLAQKFTARDLPGSMTPCRDGSTVASTWITVGEGWILLTNDRATAERVARNHEGRLLDQTGPPPSYPLPQKLVCEQAKR